MRGPVRKAIDSGQYTLAIAWEKLDETDKAHLLHYVRDYTEYGKAAHMGMLPLIAVKTIFMVLDKAEKRSTDFTFTVDKRWVRANSNIPDRIRSNIRLAIRHDLRLNERLAKQRAKERRF